MCSIIYSYLAYYLLPFYICPIIYSYLHNYILISYLLYTQIWSIIHISDLLWTNILIYYLVISALLYTQIFPDVLYTNTCICECMKQLMKKESFFKKVGLSQTSVCRNYVIKLHSDGKNWKVKYPFFTITLRPTLLSKVRRKADPTETLTFIMKLFRLCCKTKQLPWVN